MTGGSHSHQLALVQYFILRCLARQEHDLTALRALRQMVDNHFALHGSQCALHERSEHVGRRMDLADHLPGQRVPQRLGNIPGSSLVPALLFIERQIFASLP